MGSEAACAKNRKLPNIVGLGWATGGDGQGTDRSAERGGGAEGSAALLIKTGDETPASLDKDE